MKNELEMKVGISSVIYLNNIEIDPLTIKIIMINEVVPSDSLQDFYGIPNADYLKTTIPLLQGAVYPLLLYKTYNKYRKNSQDRVYY